jgi:N-acetylglucosaminyldiphosphoundecaprenol N-acetyl-beta-D-mannosaminyltransferase
MTIGDLVRDTTAVPAQPTPRLRSVPSQLPTVTLFGLAVTNATKREAVALMESWIGARDRRSRAVFIVNAHTLNQAADDPGYAALLSGGDVVFADGVGARIAARLKGVHMRDNLVGTDLVPLFMRAKRARGYRYFLLGGTPGTAERAAAQLREDVPGIAIAGCQHGWFDGAETGAVIERINAAAPDMLLVAMGNPLQEQWIATHLPALRVPVSIGVGGLFDHWAGDLQRAPSWVRRGGMEWVQLLLQQPHKWRRYVLGNPRFLSRALVDARRDRRRQQGPPVQWR